jgi:hypothetical protein
VFDQCGVVLSTLAVLCGNTDTADTGPNVHNHLGHVVFLQIQKRSSNKTVPRSIRIPILLMTPITDNRGTNTTFTTTMNLLSKPIAITLIGTAATTSAFAPYYVQRTRIHQSSPSSLQMGYLDDLSAELYAEDDSPDVQAQSREANVMDKSKVKSFGPGSFEEYVDFGDEFDGGDGQMGVAGDGNKGLETMDNVPQLAKSQSMSAKNAWGTDTGYAATLREKNPKMDTARAQQLENWQNQQEVRSKNLQLKDMADKFDSVQTTEEENWRALSKFGVERVTDFDYDEEFGAVAAGDEIEDTIEIKTALNRVETHSFQVSYCVPSCGDLQMYGGDSFHLCLI